MDVKSVFANKFISYEVYVSHTPEFKDHNYPRHEYKFKKHCIK